MIGIVEIFNISFGFFEKAGNWVKSQKNSKKPEIWKIGIIKEIGMVTWQKFAKISNVTIKSVGDTFQVLGFEYNWTYT